MNINNELTVEGVKYDSSIALAEEYKEKGVTLNSIYKRHQRGLRGDDLIPEKKRKNYVPPEPEDKNKFVVGEFKFKNAADACQKRGIKYQTYKMRLRAGWTKEEALEITPRKRGKIYNIKGENLTVKEISKKYERNLGTVRDLLKRGATPEQAAGLVEIKRGELISQVKWQKLYEKKRGSKDNSETINKTASKPPVAKINKEKSSSQIQSNLSSSPLIKNKDKTLEKVEKNHKTTFRGGRRNSTFYKNHPDIGNSPGYVYLLEVNHPNKKPAPGKKYIKVGSTQYLEKRTAELKFGGEIWFQTTSMLNASIIEEGALIFFKNKKTDRFTSSDFDGKSEVFDLEVSEVEIFKVFVLLGLLKQSQSTKNQ